MKGICQKKILLLFLVLVPQSWGQKFTLGTCPTQSSAAGWAYATQLVLAGGWRLYAQTPTLYYHNWNCVTFTGTEIIANTQYAMVIAGINKITGTPMSITATISITGAAPASPSVAGHIFTLSVPSAKLTSSVNYVLLDFVASTYVVFYSCENLAFGKIENLLVLVTSTATTSDIAKALTALSAKGYPLHALRRAFTGC